MTFLAPVLVSIAQILPFGYLPSILGVTYVLIYILLSNKLSILKLFIVLIPHICFVGTYNSDSISILPFNFQSAQPINIGSLNIDTSFAIILALNLRLFIGGIERKIISSFILYLILLFIATYGLLLSVYQGLFSAGGLTVGIRVVLLSILLFYLPKFTNFKRDVCRIAKISILIMSLGLMRGHWIFISYALIPLIIFSKEFTIRWKLFALFACFFSLFNYGYTFTQLAILSSASVLLFMARNQYILHHHLPSSFFSAKYLETFLHLMPILSIVFTLIFSVFFVVVEGNVLASKIAQDRGLIWIGTLNLILDSNPFIVPAGRDIEIYGFFGSDIISWQYGAHNIILEIARQLGLFSLTICILLYLLGLKRLFSYSSAESFGSNNIFYNRTFLCFLSVFAFYGATGNSLLVDGVGTIFWLIFFHSFIYRYNSKSDQIQGLQNQRP